MTNLSDIINALPRMKSGNELITALEILPEYTPEICAADTPLRLMALSDLYKISSSTAESEFQGYYAAGIQRYHGRFG